MCFTFWLRLYRNFIMHRANTDSVVCRILVDFRSVFLIAYYVWDCLRLLAFNETNFVCCISVYPTPIFIYHSNRNIHLHFSLIFNISSFVYVYQSSLFYLASIHTYVHNCFDVSPSPLDSNEENTNKMVQHSKEFVH